MDSIGTLIDNQRGWHQENSLTPFLAVEEVKASSLESARVSTGSTNRKDGEVT